MAFSVHDRPLEPTGFEQKTSFDSAAETVSIGDATYALLQAETNGVRWRDDGTPPTSGVGMLLPPGEDFFYTGDVKALRVIGVDGTSVLNVSGYK